TIGFGRFAIARQNTWICWTNHFVSVTIFIGASSWLMKKIHVRLLQDRFAALSSTMAKSFVIAPLRKFLRKWRAFLASTKINFSPSIDPRATLTTAATSMDMTIGSSLRAERTSRSIPNKLIAFAGWM